MERISILWHRLTAESMVGIIKPLGVGVSIEFGYQTLQAPGLVHFIMAGLLDFMYIFFKYIFPQKHHWICAALIGLS